MTAEQVWLKIDRWIMYIDLECSECLSSIAVSPF